MPIQIKRLTKGQLVILEMLKDSDEPLSSSYLTEITGRTYQVIARDIRTLHRLKCIKRIAAPEGHKFLYQFKTDEPTWPKTTRALPVDLSGELEGFSIQEVVVSIHQLSSQGWQPKIRDVIWNFSDALGKLGEFASLSAIHGEQISQTLIDEQRDNLIELLELTNQIQIQITRLLHTDELWDCNKLSGTLIEYFDLEDLLTKSKTIQALRTLEGDLHKVPPHLQ